MTKHQASSPSKEFNRLHKKLRKHLDTVKKRFHAKHPHAVEFFAHREIEIGDLRNHAKRVIASGLVASSLLLVSPSIADFQKNTFERLSELPRQEKEKMFAQLVRNHLVTEGYALTSEQEVAISQTIFDYWGVRSTPLLDAKRLNHSYGVIALEQHLRRYPGDTIYQHGKLQETGMAPGRGAFGYFAPSKNELTPEAIAQEKYYVAVQTLYLPDWNANWTKLKEWYKFRKVIVVNPENGKTVVAVIADAGPAKWTGKHFGGSPEVMDDLDLYDHARKGNVILFFVDDPDNRVPLGPVGYN